MKKKRGLKNSLCCCLYDRPCANRKLACIRKSYEEVYKILNAKECGCGKK